MIDDGKHAEYKVVHHVTHKHTHSDGNEVHNDECMSQSVTSPRISFNDTADVTFHRAAPSIGAVQLSAGINLAGTVFCIPIMPSEFAEFNLLPQKSFGGEESESEDTEVSRDSGC